MKLPFRLLPLLAIAPALTPITFAAPRESLIVFDKPGKIWEAQALPLGNGRLGAMIFGGTGADRIQFNENTLWTGDANPSGGYNYGEDRKNIFGCYQNFGDLFVEFDGAGIPVIAVTVRGKTASGDSGSGERAAALLDADPKSKFCVEHGGKPVVWQTTTGGKDVAVKSYTLTSANDVPDRDPKDWTLEGSRDGKTWVVLDKREKVLAIREALVQNKDGKTFVEIETAPKQFERRDVKLGLSDGIWAEVLSGVTATDKVKQPANAGPARMGGPGGPRGGGPRR